MGGTHFICERRRDLDLNANVEYMNGMTKKKSTAIEGERWGKESNHTHTHTRSSLSSHIQHVVQEGHKSGRQGVTFLSIHLYAELVGGYPSRIGPDAMARVPGVVVAAEGGERA